MVPSEFGSSPRGRIVNFSPLLTKIFLFIFNRIFLPFNLQPIPAPYQGNSSGVKWQSRSHQLAVHHLPRLRRRSYRLLVVGAPGLYVLCMVPPSLPFALGCAAPSSLLFVVARTGAATCSANCLLPRFPPKQTSFIIIFQLSFLYASASCGRRCTTMFSALRHIFR